MWLSKKGKHRVRKQINSCQEQTGGGEISCKGHREHLGWWSCFILMFFPLWALHHCVSWSGLITLHIKGMSSTTKELQLSKPAAKMISHTHTHTPTPCPTVLKVLMITIFSMPWWYTSISNQNTDPGLDVIKTVEEACKNTKNQSLGRSQKKWSIITYMTVTQEHSWYLEGLETGNLISGIHPGSVEMGAKWYKVVFRHLGTGQKGQCWVECESAQGFATMKLKNEVRPSILFLSFHTMYHHVSESLTFR